jgi:hypothetical protein
MRGVDQFFAGRKQAAVRSGRYFRGLHANNMSYSLLRICDELCLTERRPKSDSRTPSTTLKLASPTVASDSTQQERTMSTVDPTDGLTDKQRAVFDKYTEYCAKNIDKLVGQKQMGCIEHTVVLNQMTQRARDKNDMLLQLDSLRTSMEESLILNEWINRWQTQAAAMLASFVNASYGYDMILGLKSTVPVEYNALLELAICLLPELRPCQRVFQFLVKSGAASEDPAMKLAQFGIALLDRRSKDVTNVARAAAKSGGATILDKSSVRLKSGYQAKNEVFRYIIDRTMESLLAATAADTDLNQKILHSSISKADLLMEIHKNDPGPILSAENYELLSDQILYHMLRTYMQRHGDVEQYGDDWGGSQTWRAGLTKANGLDKAAPEEIFARFNSKNWKGNMSYPPIDSVEDMVVKWMLPFKKVYAPDYGPPVL